MLCIHAFFSHPVMKTILRLLLFFLLLLATRVLRLVAQPTPAVGSYALVNTNTDLDIQPLASGAVLDLPTHHLNICANPSQVTVGSVVFNLSGAATQAATENVVPCSLFSRTFVVERSPDGQQFVAVGAVPRHRSTGLPLRRHSGPG
jgi:hypothetical protein